MGRYSKGPLDSDSDLDDEVVKDKPIIPLIKSNHGGIKIKGLAKAEEESKKQRKSTLKQDILTYLHVKKRIDNHLKTRQEKLNTIINQVKVDLTIIRRKHGDVHSYNQAKSKYIQQFFPLKHDATAFTKKHLRNI